MSRAYLAGISNIGVAEAKHRRITYGFGGLALSLALFVIIRFLGVSEFVYLILVVPIYVSTIGFMQSRSNFCIAYGKRGLCNVSGDIGETREVIGGLNRKKDEQKANNMIKRSLIISAAITLVLAAASSLIK